MAKARAGMADWFGRLPRADCVLAEVSTGPKAFYFLPAPDGSRPGTFFVNTAEPAEWGRFEIEATAYHEAIPGHHFQIMLQRENEELPRFRRFGGFTAFSEGWGLYAERLAAEMDLYKTPQERFEASTRFRRHVKLSDVLEFFHVQVRRKVDEEFCDVRINNPAITSSPAITHSVCFSQGASSWAPSPT